MATGTLRCNNEAKGKRRMIIENESNYEVSEVLPPPSKRFPHAMPTKKGTGRVKCHRASV